MEISFHFVILNVVKDLVYIHVDASEMLHYVQHDKMIFAIHF